MTAPRTARKFPLIVALALALALVPAALAAKGGGGKPSGGGGSGSLSGPVMLSDVGTPGVSYGDQITFSVSTSWTYYPSVVLYCTDQNGALVYKDSVGFYPTYIGTRYFTLSSSLWTGGAANCTATLYYTAKNGSRTTVGTLSFPVAA